MNKTKKAFLGMTLTSLTAMAALMLTGCWLLGSNAEDEESENGSGKKQNTPDAPGIYNEAGNLMPDTETLAKAFLWLNENADAEAVYTVKLSEDELVSQELTLDVAHLHEMSGVTVKLESLNPEKPVELALSEKVTMFRVQGNAALVIGNGITLKGRSGNNQSLVYVNGGTLELEDGAKITGNRSNFEGGGVFVEGNGSRFTMNGGEISGNSTNFLPGYRGGGVFIKGEGAVFHMIGGIISENFSMYGGGVCTQYKTTFTMSGGTISRNFAFQGAGVCVDYLGTAADFGSTFIKEGGTVYGEDADGDSNIIVVDTNKNPVSGRNRGSSLLVGCNGTDYKCETTMTEAVTGTWTATRKQ